MSEQKNPNEIELSTGVKLIGKPMPPGVFINLSVDEPPPRPPTYKSGEGDNVTYYTNPDDPGFIDAKKFWDDEQGKKMLNAMVVFGTEVSEIPKGFPKLADQGWVDELEVAGVKVMPENKSWRRLWWTLSLAAPTSDDWDLIAKVVGRLSGVPEQDAENATEFPERA